jgi:glycosyltransferase involved in cell wall biosynthesis
MESFFHSFSGADRFRDLPLGTRVLIYPPEKKDVSPGYADFLEMGEELQIPTKVRSVRDCCALYHKPSVSLSSVRVGKMAVAELQETMQDEQKDARGKNPLGRRPLRVCMVAYTFYETDSRVMRYAEALAQRGDLVDVFALKKPGTPRVETLGGVRVRRLQGRLFNEKGLFSYIWRVLLFLVRSLYQVSIHDLRKKYDIVHIHSVPDFLVFSALLPRFRGAPIILDIRDILPEFYASKFGVTEKSLGFRLLCVAEKFCTRFADHVIIANHTWQERLLSRSVNPGKSTVVLNVPDRSIFTPRKQLKEVKDRFLILYHGTLNWHQGLDLAVRAFAKIKNLVPEAEFHIYGDGPSKPELLLLIEQLLLENRVLLHERIPLREIPSVIETAKLGIVPKRKDNFGNEAFSTKILEFMAMGVPVIVSDTKVDRYYFDDSVVRFFRGEDEDDLAHSMLDLIRHREMRQTLIERATEFVARNDWTPKKHEYLKLIDGLLPVANS